MHKILIVDDFSADRDKLEGMIDSLLDRGIEVVGTCETGPQALELVGSREPDIVISDIELPGMSGLDLAKAIRNERPDVRVIFCTLYDHFEYAKEAIHLGGYGYLLKPVDAEELRECIDRVVGSLDSQSRQREEYRRLKGILHESRPVLVENMLKDVLYGLNKDARDIERRAEYLGLRFGGGSYSLALIEIDDLDRSADPQDMERRQILSLRVYERLQQATSTLTGLTVVRIDDAHFAAILGLCGAEDSDGTATALASTCAALIGECSDIGVSLSVAQSDTCPEPTGLASLYEQSRYLLRHKYSLGKGKVLRCVDVPSGLSHPTVDYNAIQREIRYLLNSGSPPEIERYVRALFDGMPKDTEERYLKDVGLYVALCMQITLSENNDDMHEALGDAEPVWQKLVGFETASDMQRWLLDRCLHLNSYLARKATQNSAMLTREVKKYVEANYGADLGLDALAAALQYSPNYLNHVFKQDTGETICEYVCRYRVQKAKEMLADPRLRLYDIAESLGYRHAAYFSGVFKKHTGLTPKEYRERCAR